MKPIILIDSSFFIWVSFLGRIGVFSEEETEEKFF
jgi:hypothetical protein